MGKQIYFPVIPNDVLIGNNPFMVFMGGIVTTTIYCRHCVKCFFTTYVIAVSSLLSSEKTHIKGAGNFTLGIVAGGGNNAQSTYSNTVEAYFYSSDAIISGGNLVAARTVSTATGNLIIAIMFSGYNGGNLSSTEKYTYSTLTAAAGTAISPARRDGASVGNATVAIFGGGYSSTYVTTTDKYTYSGDVRVAGTVLGLARYVLRGISCLTYGIFAGGSAASATDYTDKYTFSSDVVAPSTVLLATRTSSTGTGNNAMGFFVGGTVGGVSSPNSTDKFTFSNETIVAGFSLGSGISCPGSLSSTPGGLSL